MRYTGTEDAERIIYCDVCLEGMGFWYPHKPVTNGFYSPVPLDVPEQFILYYEALCILSTLHHAANTSSKPICIAIFTDNSNTVDIFNSLRALPA